MKLKFNFYERVAGLFVLVALTGAALGLVGVAISRGWFEPKVNYRLEFPSAEGIHIGTGVQISGLRAGEITSLDLDSEKVLVTIEVNQKFASRVHADSRVAVLRPFILSEKVLDISVGSSLTTPLAANSKLEIEDTIDVLDLISGRKLAPHLREIDSLFAQISPLLKNATTMSHELSGTLRQVNKNNQLGVAMQNLVNLTNELNQALPTVKKNAPELLGDLTKIARNLSVLTDEMTAIAPGLPHASERAVEALNETVVTLKAMQKSIFLRGSVREVREEEAQKPSDERLPASK